MTLSRKHKLLFIHIPRNAGKSIASALRRNYKDAKKVEWEHARLKDVAKKYNLKAFKKFAVVRNPWERLVSLWAYLISHKKTYEARDKKVRDVGELSMMGFSHWLLNYGKLSNYIITSDTPQVSWITLKGRIAVDNIIRFEDLDHGFEKVTGLSKKLLPVQHQTEHHGYQRYYNDDSRAFVDKHFARDIEQWGYVF